MTQLEKRYNKVCEDYVRKFCKKQGLIYESDIWVADKIGGNVWISGMILNFMDIVWDINSEQPKQLIIDWYWESFENIDNSINYYSYSKGLRYIDI